MMRRTLVRRTATTPRTPMLIGTTITVAVALRPLLYKKNRGQNFWFLPSKILTFKEMMRKIKGIYPEIIAKDNLYRSAYMASRGRRYRDSVADFNFSLEKEIETLHGELLDKSYRHGKYRVFTIYDPKERNIAAAPFRDRVVHHAVHDIIEPILDETFIYHSYACRKNRGSHKAVDIAQEFLRLNAFCFHGDIKKYFFSIDHGILKGIINSRIEDKDLLWLINEIIDSAKQLAAGEAQFTTKGLPIGNLTSQFFANLYLNELDYFVKFDLKIKFYLRYMDDVMIFGNDKAGLIEVKAKIRGFLKERLRLDIQEAKSQIYKNKNGVKFLGFRLFKNHRRIASSNVRRFKKRLKNFGYLLENKLIDKNKICDSVRCWAAHSSYADTNGLRLNIYENLGKKRPYLSALLKDILLDNGTVAKLRFFGISSIRGTILDPNNKNGIWEEVSLTEVRLKPNIDLKKDAVREIAKGDFDKVWAILQQSHNKLFFQRERERERE